MSENWNRSVRLGLSTARFDEPDAVFLTRRAEETRSAGLTFPHRRLSREGCQPVLKVDWSRTDSNVALHDRKALSFRHGPRRLF